MNGEFHDKVALVTGAGKGIGAAAARAFAAAGAAVGVLDADGPAAKETVATIMEAGGAALALEADVRREDEVAGAIAELVSACGGVDVLANVAGIIRYGEVPDFAEEDWDAVLGVNLKGTFLTCKHVIPQLRLRGGGAIVNTASVQAYNTQRTVAAYAASKGAVVTLTKTIALDHAAEGIRVNAIAPGSVRTPMLAMAAELFGDGDTNAQMEEWGRLHPIGRLIEPEEVAETILYLAGPRAAAVTGTTVVVDGGLICGVAL